MHNNLILLSLLCALELLLHSGIQSNVLVFTTNEEKAEKQSYYDPADFSYLWSRNVVFLVECAIDHRPAKNARKLSNKSLKIIATVILQLHIKVYPCLEDK